MFIAIINDTYAEIKAELANQKSDIELGSYLKKGYNKVLSKMNIRQNQILDIQKAITTADANGDKQIDYIEWRNNLRVCVFLLEICFRLSFILFFCLE